MPPQQGTNWSYPPSPAHYQAGAPGQAPFNPATTRPFQARPTGPFSQTTQPTNTFETTYPGPIQHTAQPGLPHGSMYPQAGTISQPPGKPKRSGMRTGAILALTLLLAAVFASGLVSGWTLRSSNTPSSNNNGLQPGNTSTVTVPQLTDNNADAVREAVVNKVQPGVVQIDVTSNGQRALGSGVIIDGRGYIVTNNHVVSGASTIQVTLADGTVLPGKLAGSDKADDLAIVKITPPASGLTVVEIGDSSQLKVGQEVLALGSPLGNSETVTRGIVSALNRNVSEGQNAATLPDAIQTDAPINPGNSGGALVDMQGKLIGIPTLNAVDTEYNTPANGLGFAIPSNRVKFIAEQVINDGSVTHTGRAFMGVSISSVTQAVADQNNLGVNSGAVISSLTAGGPAANAGLRQNDVITQIDTTAIHSTTDVSSALLQHKPGDTVTIKYYRGTQQLSTNLVLGELPVS
ncbi:MAG TPA: trypsin-like peptidase domain-containing protein, partial [Ktedonobacteraceae bacterium]|nr:trypsin-like peptidase domain-containing protein [Ktedonobacteraceae bacterium]